LVGETGAAVMKMKSFLLISLSSCVAAHQLHSEHQQFRSWAEAKAMESCWGEENNKLYLTQMKQAMAKCRHQDAPELELPPFRSSYKLANFLTNAADTMDQYKVNKMFDFMRMFRENQHQDFSHFSSHNEYDMFKEMMLKYQMKEMMENYMKADSFKPNNFDIPYSGRFGYKDHKARSILGMLRNTRAAAEDTIRNIELGDRLVAKINAFKDSMMADIGNMTCVLQECGMLTPENEIDPGTMKQKLAEYSLPSEWFKGRFEELIDNCHEIATNLPASSQEQNLLSGDFGQVNVGQIKHFLACYKEQHQKLCMDQDTRTKIEENYGPVADLLEKTGWTEHQLLTAFQVLTTKEDTQYFGY
jgi:hypothetical protein